MTDPGFPVAITRRGLFDAVGAAAGALTLTETYYPAFCASGLRVPVSLRRASFVGCAWMLRPAPSNPVKLLGCSDR